MVRIAIETMYLEPAELAEFHAFVRDWAVVSLLPSRNDEYEYRNTLAGCEIAIGSPMPAWVLESSLRVVLMPSAGYEEFVGAGFERRDDISLCNGRGVFSVGIAEHTMSLMLAFARRLPRFFEAQQHSNWARTWEGYSELAGQTLVIVGLGSVGAELAKRAAGFDMRVLGVRRNADILPKGVEKIYPVEFLHEALHGADQVVVALPGGEATRNLISASAIGAIKPGAFLYNVGRGTSVDQVALLAALNSGHLAGAGLDVFENEPLPASDPLWQMKQVILTPHVAGYSPGFRRRFGKLVVENLRRYRDGKELLNRIPLRDLSGHGSA